MLVFDEETLADMDAESLKAGLYEDFADLYKAKEEEIGADKLREVERMILIRVVDNKWMDHIDAMDQLKSGIGLRGLGGQDPAAAYAQEGFDMFEMMINGIKEEFVKFCYNVTVQTTTQRKNVLGSGEGRKDEYRGRADGGRRTGRSLIRLQCRSGNINRKPFAETHRRLAETIRVHVEAARNTSTAAAEISRRLRRLKHKYRNRKGCECMQIDEIKAQLPALQSMLKEAGESL